MKLGDNMDLKRKKEIEDNITDIDSDTTDEILLKILSNTGKKEKEEINPFEIYKEIKREI